MAVCEIQERIKDRVMGVVRYLSEALLRPRSSEDQPSLMPDKFVRGESNYYYVMLTIYYVDRYMEPLAGKEFIPKEVEKSELFVQERLPSDSFNFAMCDKDKVVLLKWYHYASLLALHHSGVIKSQHPDRLAATVENLHRAAKVVSAAKLTAKSPYEANDEIFDRLALLGSELSFPQSDDMLIQSLSIARIRQRSFTTTVNPGSREHHDDRPTTAPWEVYALCHHSRLMVMSLELNCSENGTAIRDIIEKFEQLKTRLCHFLNTEGTIVPCWERAYTNASRGWLRSEATAVVAYTLMDMHDHLLRLSSTEKARRALKLAFNKTKSLEAPQTEQSRSEKWLETFEPPAKYHPEGFVESLRSTPWIYKGSLLPARVPIHGTLKDFVRWWDPGSSVSKFELAEERKQEPTTQRITDGTEGEKDTKDNKDRADKEDTLRNILEKLCKKPDALVVTDIIEHDKINSDSVKQAVLTETNVEHMLDKLCSNVSITTTPPLRTRWTLTLRSS
jgi:hypothetical protein